MQRIQVAVLADGRGAEGQNVLEVLAHVVIPAPQKVLGDTRGQRDARHAVEVGRVVVRVHARRELLGPLRVIRERLFGVFVLWFSRSLVPGARLSGLAGLCRLASPWYVSGRRSHGGRGFRRGDAERDLLFRVISDCTPPGCRA